MIIEQLNNEVTFEELKIGDVFRCSKAIYIKTDYYTSDGGYEINSYDLSTNDFCYFPDYNKVEKVKAKLVIE